MDGPYWAQTHVPYYEAHNFRTKLGQDGSEPAHGHS
jgi:hypothetical protein